MRYAWLRKLHLWLSLTAALPWLVLSLTGALLVYGHELQEALQPDLWTVERPSPDAEPLPFSTLRERVAEQMPDARIWSFGIGGDPGMDPQVAARVKAWTLYLAGGKGVVNLNHYTGEIVHLHKGDESPYNIVRAIHRRWFTSDETVTPIVRNVISALSLLLIAQVLVGLAMWLVPKKRFQRLKVDFRKSTRHVVLRLHQVTGVVTALIVITVAFTGMALWWHEEIVPIVEAVTGQKIVTPTDPDLPADQLTVTDLDAAVAAGRAAFPDAQLMHFRAPQPGKPLAMGLQSPDTLVTHRVWVGGDPPRVLAVDDGRAVNAATWFWRLRYTIHLGDFAGPIVRALWVIVALLPTAYVISGLWLWLNRRGKRREKPAPAVNR